ncbi:hypothetical protein GCM10017567_41860 [Amycolatopsis bullii]|uniref:Transposase n=1 Tax=Amycolatopsis bullii TaxID=941987 RepID=A0ABQ3KEX6_9PSEU|nr:hypothetical protein GCM10017567_41860 [Amycolatopsis bullii]
MDLGYIKVTYFVGRALPVNGKSARGKSARYRPARVDSHRPVLPSLKDPLPNGPRRVSPPPKVTRPTVSGSPLGSRSPRSLRTRHPRRVPPCSAAPQDAVRTPPDTGSGELF